MNKDTNQIMALINAYRMDGLGNNFVIIDRRQTPLEINREKITSLANKKNIKFDQLITLEKQEEDAYPINIFNRDGSEITACGNGSRCIAYLISEEKKQKKIFIKTKERILNAEVIEKQIVKINMGKPKFNWQEIPLSKNMNTKQVGINLVEKEYGNGFCLNLGNPHIVFFVKDCFKVDLKKIGPKIENHTFFPEKTNVTFAQVLDKTNIKVNVWERGAGQTKACGTAACATVIAGFSQALVEKNSKVIFKEGKLEIDYQEEVFMTGTVSEIKKINLDI